MRSSKPSAALLIIALLSTAMAVAGVWCLWLRIGTAAINTALAGMGISLGPCLAAYALVPIKRKQWARRLVLLTGGVGILAFSLTARANLDMEGFFLLILEGVVGAAIGHTLATVIVGPALFGRILCGWGCWRAMVVELLPRGLPSVRRRGIWPYLPFAGVACSAASAGVGFFLFGHHAGGAPGSPHTAGTVPILVGVAVYLAAAACLAFALNDQRAFCKYLCPNSVILRLTSRLSALKMATDSRRCNGCGACSRVCPMGIDVRALAVSGRRVGTGECILCQRCAQVCPVDAISATYRFKGLS